MLEKEIQNNILEFLNHCAIESWPNQSVGVYDPIKKIYRKSRNKYHRNGIMDILGYLPNGTFLGIEVKSKKGVASPDQKKQICIANDNKAVAFVSRSVWQTYQQLIPFYPEIKAFEFLAKQYQQLENEKEH
jgi:hypothetical protein